MDKNAIKRYAVWARRELIARVSQRALRYEIIAEGCGDANADSVHGTLLSGVEKKQRQALIAQIEEKSYEQVMEEVAYTWFNRFSALRFMEVNGYLPSHVRVFTDEDNNFKPQIITEAIHLELDSLDMEKVYALKDENKTDELYKYLLITQCNALSSILPGMFQKIEDYTELLFPENLLRDGSVIQLMIELIPEDDWKDAVQIIGWLYQYYNSEKKDDVFAALKKNIKITKENIPAATQLFTPDWIVRYMVENSLGRLWVEGHPNDELKAGWKYYLEEAEQEPEVEEQLAKIRKEYEGLKPEDIKCIDPCCGSGHILAYLFDVLMQIYEAYGYTTREAVASIVENNIYGLDIDDRAAQLAYFAVMMKARQYDRRFFSHVVQPHIYAVQESNHIQYDKEYGDFLLSEEHRETLRYLLNAFRDAKEYGTIIDIEEHDYVGFLKAWKNAESSLENIVMIGWYTAANERVPALAHQAILLSQKYNAVVTNPPYRGMGDVEEKLQNYVKQNYPDSKQDLSTIFMEKCDKLCTTNGFYSMINIPVWMLLTTFTKMRKSLYSNDTIINLMHIGRGVFGSDFGTVAFVIRSGRANDYLSTCKRLYDRAGDVEPELKKIERYFSPENTFFTKVDDYFAIPGERLAYWASSQNILAYKKYKPLSDFADVKKGMSTADDNRFLRFWYEISKVKFNVFGSTAPKWFRLNKGGSFRRWYGNNDYVVNWENNGIELKGFSKSVIRNEGYYFKPIGLTWTYVTNYKLNVRYYENAAFAATGPGIFPVNESWQYILGFLNTKVAQLFANNVGGESITYEVGEVASIPVAVNSPEKQSVERIVNVNVSSSKEEWDCYELSWDFQRHPLISVIAKKRMHFDDIDNTDLSECFMAWENECNGRFNQLKANEEELNRIFIDIYGLQDELTPEVEVKDVTVRKADLQREVKSLISYAVGCMFGRYSLEKAGLVYAGGDFESVYDKFVPTNQNMSDYTHAELSNFSVDELQKPFYYLRETQNKPLFSFHVDADNIIPICSDEYFADDIVGRFVKFIETVYGKKALDSNLKFIADALGGKGQPIDVIRNYFINDFYADHCKIYQKRPIYWLFDSGKKGGFKALIYMHRYQQDTIARMRTDYVHEQQGRYRTEISDLETRIAGASTSERVKLNKQLSTLQDKATEIRQYEEKIHHLADQMIRIDLDDGVKHNYATFQDVLAKIK